MAAEELRIDVSNYKALKEAKAARIFKVDGVAHYATRRYDAVTGKPGPLAVPLDRDAVVAARAKAQEGVDALDLVLADIDAAQEI